MTQAEWGVLQQQNPEGFGQFVAIEGSQYATAEQQEEWQKASSDFGGVQIVGNTLYGYMPANPSWTQPPVVEEEVQTEDNLATNQAPIEDTYEADQAALVAEGEAEEETIHNFWDAEIANELTILDEGFSNLDEDFARQMASITAMFGVRRAALDQLNAATMGGLTKSGIRSGRQRYANEMQTSILSAEEAAGIQRIATLNAEELMLKSDLESAIRDKRWDLMNYKTDKLRELRANKKAELADLRIKQQDENNRLQNEIRWEREGIEWEQGQALELYKTALAKVDNLLFTDVAITDMAAEDIAQLEEDLDLMAGTFETFYANRIAAQAAADALAAAELTEDLLDIEKKRIDADVKILNAQLDVPQGVEFKINGVTYTGLKAPKGGGVGSKFGPGIQGIKLTIKPADAQNLVSAGWLQSDISQILTIANTPYNEAGDFFSFFQVMAAVQEELKEEGREITPAMKTAFLELFSGIEFESDLFTKFGGESNVGLIGATNMPSQLSSLIGETINKMEEKSLELNLDSDYDTETLSIELDWITEEYNLTFNERAELKDLIISQIAWENENEDEEEGGFSLSEWGGIIDWR